MGAWRPVARRHGYNRPRARPVRILFLSPYVPSRIRVRPYHWILELAALGHAVHLVALQPPGEASPADEDLRDACERIDLFPLTRGRTLANAVRALHRPRVPLQLAYSQHPGAVRHVQQLAASGRFDVVHVEHMRGVALSRGVRGVPVVYDAVDSISALFAETARHAPSRGARLLARIDLARSRRFEADAPRAFSRVVVTSRHEAAAFVALAGDAAARRVTVVGNGVDAERFRPSNDDGRPRCVVFTGKLSYHANAAAAVRLVRRVMPIVWAQEPHAPVVLAGKDPSRAVAELAADPRVRVTGFLEDMRLAFADAAVAVCPLVYGAGIQNKVLESLASGVATVITPAAAGALSGVEGRHYLARESDGDIAEAVVTLLRDEALRRRLAAEGREYVLAHHRWEVLASRLVRVYEEVAAGHPVGGAYRN